MRAHCIVVPVIEPAILPESGLSRTFGAAYVAMTRARSRASPALGKHEEVWGARDGLDRPAVSWACASPFEEGVGSGYV